MNTIGDLSEINNIDAYDLIDKMGITCAPVDVFTLANSLPIKVDCSIDTNDRIDLAGEIFIDKLSNMPVIWVNPLDYENRQRFTMAHEIAHLVNDIIPNMNNKSIKNEFHDNSTSLKRDGRQDPREFKANEFAAQLLMPAEFVFDETKKIITDYKSKNGNTSKIPREILISQLSEIFKVSKQAMTIRFNRLVS
jgi:Zn-dependent peptidase ImmA (M78 family)